MDKKRFSPMDYLNGKDFGIDMPEITNDRLFDLSSYVAYLSEKKTFNKAGFMV